MKFWRRFLNWAAAGSRISQRQFLLSYLAMFLVVTFLLAAVMYLVRENQQRTDDVKEAVIQSCRDSNEVRAEMRKVIQEIKNTPTPDFGTLETIQRYERLTKAQAFMVDKRCVPLRK
jgi:hypothetical protein